MKALIAPKKRRKYDEYDINPEYKYGRCHTLYFTVTARNILIFIVLYYCTNIRYPALISNENL